MERRRSEMARVTVSDEFLWQNYLAPFDPSSDANDSGHESSDDESDFDDGGSTWARLPDLLLVKVAITIVELSICVIL